MKPTAPLFRLKRDARRLSRDANIPLHEALDRIAAQEGFPRWSLLAAKDAARDPAERIFAGLEPGDLLLVGARPRQGKTLLALKLAAEAMKSGLPSWFFTLEYNEADVLDRFDGMGIDRGMLAARFTLDMSDAISADHIGRRVAAAPRGSVVVVDFLQLLDQRRENPELAVQLRALKALAIERGLIVVVISQIDRAFETSGRPMPSIGDVRTPNPVDLTLFTKTCFLNRGETSFGAP